jgi:hypothetical protein
MVSVIWNRLVMCVVVCVCFIGMIHFSMSSHTILSPLLPSHTILSPLRKIQISHTGNDGMGHQILGMYSCMLLALVDSRFEYVKKVHTGSTHSISTQLAPLFDVLQCNSTERPPIPSLRTSQFSRRGFDGVVESDHQWSNIITSCTKNRTRCELSMRELSHSIITCVSKSNFKTQISRNKTHREILMHVRGGDRPDSIRKGLEKHPYTLEFIRQKTGIDNVVIVCEFENDAVWIRNNWIPYIYEVSPSLKIDFLIGEDPVETWWRMIRADVLILGSSSFSVSAALLRTGPTFCEDQNPIDGRYDNRMFACVVDLDSALKLPNATAKPPTGNVFFEIGHGSQDCNLDLTAQMPTRKQ